MVHRINKIAKRKVNLLASDWAAPAWMKEDGQNFGGGSIKEDLYGVLANYQCRYAKGN